MLTAETQDVAKTETSAAAVREQLELLVQDPAFRSSKRSVQFLRFVVQQTLEGSAEQIKERTIGVEVFGRSPSYDTNLDHIVRTAAIELRKRLAMYYGEEAHRGELHISLVPGSYIPHFAYPPQNGASVVEGEGVHAWPAADQGAATRARPAQSRRRVVAVVAAVCCIALVGVLVYAWAHRPNAQDLFWSPVLETQGPVLLAAGDVPDGPPTSSTAADGQGIPLPSARKTSTPSLPFADAVTMARVLGTLESRGKRVIVRREDASSFSDFRENPVVLIGAFNNEWSLRLTRRMRFSLALDPERHLIYIKDANNPAARAWSWATDQPTDATSQGSAGSPALQDYALISRIWNSETGHAVIVIGGLYTYGTEAAGEFLTDPQAMQAISKEAALRNSHSNLQIVLGTTVTDGTAGPPRVLAVVTE